jgi:shikimate dehydrogenase
MDPGGADGSGVEGSAGGRVAPSGSTLVAAVIGDPVAHSRSPAIHNAAFAAAGLDWVFVALRVPRGGGAAAVSAARTLGLAGMSVTMPHKEEVIPALDALSPEAEILSAVNCIGRDGDRLVGHNTDGAGFVASLREAGTDVSGSRVLVVGAGGAARSVVLALARAGADRVDVANRSPRRGLDAVALAGGAGSAVGPDGLDAAVRGADLVVNATPLGMAAGDPLPVPAEALHDRQVVADLVYHPERTPLLAAAQERGAVVVGGLGMLVHQAAAAFSIWTGRDAPVGAMRDGARAAARPGG